ncbi:hypothetical protein AK812_SmicGene33157 [Symbiodinium microadriaticum]|uniref:Uncharacterized protein n=1 Tax=Symbiodinium microadriaticum TaxID=2951 RepID=A0A1Q9CSC4_SYMMI|nr:hypothetical protein AK812_SmicGene33157 [Symbiodinium microadriaticum]
MNTTPPYTPDNSKNLDLKHQSPPKFEANHAWTTWNAYELTTALWASRNSQESVIRLLSEMAAASSSITLGWVAWFTLTGTLGLRNNAGLDEMQKRGKLAGQPRFTTGEAPTHRISAFASQTALSGGFAFRRAALEMWYLLLGNILWQASLAVLKNLINMLMPKELQFYAPWLPFFKLGEDVDIGNTPVTFTNVKHTGYSRELRYHVEMFGTARLKAYKASEQAQDMWTKPGPRLKKFEASRCKDTSSGGLIANVNCFFPHLSGDVARGTEYLEGTTSARFFTGGTEYLEGTTSARFFTGGTEYLEGTTSARFFTGGESVEREELWASRHAEPPEQPRADANTGLDAGASSAPTKLHRQWPQMTLGEKAPDKCRYCGKPGYGYPFF